MKHYWRGRMGGAGVSAAVITWIAGCSTLLDLDHDYVFSEPPPTADGGTGGASDGGTGGAEEDGGASPDGGAEEDGGASPDGGMEEDSGAPLLEVVCGEGAACPIVDKSACCWNRFDQKGQCVTGPGSCDTSANGAQSSYIQCQTDADCEVGVCCGERLAGDMGNYYAKVTCEAQCGVYKMCDDLGEAGPDCPLVEINGEPVQTTCKIANLLPPGYFACAP
jgi:hypothetical protein